MPIGVETGWHDRDDNEDEKGSKNGGGVGMDGVQKDDDDSFGAMENRRSSRSGGGADGTLTMHAVVLSTDGAKAIEASVSRFVASREEAEVFGKDVAAILVERGAAEILRDIGLDRGIVAGQGGA